MARIIITTLSKACSANVGGGGIPRDTETGEKVTSETVTQIPIQIKHKKRSASPLTSSEAKEEMKINPTNENVARDANTDFESGQEYKSVTVSTHWAWDDIFHTVNTTDEEGRHKMDSMLYSPPTNRSLTQI